MDFKEILKLGIKTNLNQEITEDFELLELVEKYKLQCLENSFIPDNQDYIQSYIFWKLVENDLKYYINKENN